MAGPEISFQDAMQPPDAAPPPDSSQPTQPGEIPFDQAMLPAGNGDDQQPPSSSAIGAFARGALESALPTVVGGAAGEASARAGAVGGAELGAAGGPIGAIAGGIAGGLGGGYLASLGQDAVLDALGLREGSGLLSRAQQIADEQQHPYASEAGGLLDTLLSFGIAGQGTSKLARAGGAAIMGGVQAGQDAQNGEFDPTKIALATAAGALTGRPRGYVQDIGDRTEAAIAGLKGTGTGTPQSATATQPGTPGRPDLDGTPAPAADKSDINVANDITTTAPGVAADNPAVPKITGAGNPEGAPMVAREAAKPGDPTRDYGKGQVAPAEGVETAPSTKGVSTDPIALDVQSALGSGEPPPPATSGLVTNEAQPAPVAPQPAAAPQPAPNPEAIAQRNQAVKEAFGQPASTEAAGEQPPVAQPPAPEKPPVTPANMDFVARTIQQLRGIGYNDVADRMEKLPPDQQYAAAQQLERMNRGQTGRRPAVGGVQARTKAQATMRQGLFDKMDAAIKQFPPEKPGFIPTSVPDKQAMLTRLKQLVDAATGGQDPASIYKPNQKPANWQLVKQAYKLISAKRPSQKMFADFASAEKLLLEGGEGAARDVQQTNTPTSSAPPDLALAQSGRGRIEFPPFDNSDGGESKVFADQQTQMRDWLNGLDDADYSLLSDRHPDLEANVEGTQDPGALHKALMDDLAEGQSEQIKSGRRQPVTADRPIVDTVKNFLGNESGLATAPSWLKSIMNPRGIFSPRADDATMDYGESMGNRFHQYRNFRQALDTEIRQIAQKASNTFTEMKNPTFYQAVYRSFEPDGDKISLTPRQQALRDMLMPLYKKGIAAYEEIRMRRPDMQLPPASEGYIRHVQKGIHDWEPGSEDPILGIAKQTLSEQTSPLMDRTFFDLVSPTDNKRYLVSYTDDGGLTRWLNGRATKINNADLPANFHPGEIVGVGGHQFWIDHATARDINQHARVLDDQGKLQQVAYLENPGYAIAEGYRQLATSLERIKMMDHWLGNSNLNTAQEARGPNDAPFPPSSEAMQYMAKKGSAEAKAHPDWQESKLPQFKGWMMAKPLQDVVNDFVKPGMGGDAFQWMERSNSRLTKLMFLSPVFHGANVLQTWGTARGMRWLQPTAYRQMFGEDMPRAIKSVTQQDSIQDRIMKAGGTLEYPALLNRNSLSQIADLFGLEVKNNMPGWERVVDPFYQASSKAMWFFNDALMTHLFLEGTERLGLSDQAAVQRAHEMFPSYEVQQRLFGSRDLANFINDPRVSLFGRYRSGILKSYANIYNGLRSQNPEQAKKAMGYLIGAAFTNLVIFGGLDWLARKVTGNNQATFGAHGLMTIPAAATEAFTGKAGDQTYTKALQDIFSLAPIPHTMLDMWQNRNWIGKNIVQPQDLDVSGKSMGEAAKGLGRAALQGTEHVAGSLIPPLGVAESVGMRKGTNPVAETAKYLSGIRTPSPGTERFQAHKAQYDRRAQAERMKHPQGLAEYTYDQIFGR